MASYTWDLQSINLSGNPATFKFTSGAGTQGTFNELTNDTVAEEALNGGPLANNNAEVFGDSDPTSPTFVPATSEYVTIGGTDYNYEYLGYEAFPLKNPDPGGPIDANYAIIQLDNGDYYALNLANAGDPSNGQTSIGPNDLITDQLYIDGGVVQPPCFTAGTQILGEFSETSIEELSVGDRVWTMDRGLQKIRWIGSKHLTGLDLVRAKHLRPILIKAGALGKNYPETDLKVSPQHRIYVRSAIAERMFGSSEVLVAAKQLLGLPDIDYVNAALGVTYYHILFDRHEVVFANGAFAESFYTGKQALNAIEESSKQEIFEIFPELRETEAGVEGGFDPARPFVAGKNARALAERHVKNGKPLVETEKRA